MSAENTNPLIGDSPGSTFEQINNFLVLLMDLDLLNEPPSQPTIGARTEIYSAIAQALDYESERIGNQHIVT